MQTIETLRTIEKTSFRVEFEAHPEDIDPADTVFFGEDDESKAAERAYLEKIYSGEIPWFCLGVHIWDTSGPIEKEVGSSYLGGVDTYDLHGVGVRDMVQEAVREARKTTEEDRLSKAAPAMLEALEVMVREFGQKFEVKKDFHKMVAYEAARAAIAQARGN